MGNMITFDHRKHLVSIKTGSPLRTIAAYYRVGSVQKSSINPNKTYLRDFQNEHIIGVVFEVEKIETLN